MKNHVALLRAVNVGGHNMVAMADLRELLAGLGFENPRSLLQSGNLVFGAAAGAGAGIERTLAAGARKHLGLETDFFVRNAREWAELVAANPFRREAERDPGRLIVMFLKDAPAAAAVKALQAAITGPEVVRAGTRHLYIVYPDGTGRSRLTNAVIEGRLGTRGTGRNWNTVLKLGALAG